MLGVGSWREDSGFMIAMKRWFNLTEISAKAVAESPAAQSSCDSLLGCLIYIYIYIFNGKPSFNIGVFSILGLESRLFLLTLLVHCGLDSG